MNLLSNNKLYGPLTPYIENSLLNDEWERTAACIFIEKRKQNLTDQYLSNIIEKYNFDTVLFNVGRYHCYTGYMNDDQKKYFSAGFDYGSKKVYWGNVVQNLVGLVSLVLAIVIFYGMSIMDNSNNLGLLIVVGGLILLLLDTWLSTKISSSIPFKFEIKNVLKKEGIEELEPINFNTFYTELYPYY